MLHFCLIIFSLLGYRNSPESVQGNHLGTIVEKLRKDSVYYDLFNQEDVANGNYNQPSLQYEETRRKIRNNVQEMW